MLAPDQAPLFSIVWIAGGGEEVGVGNSRLRKGERGVWQRRFYEHTCRDERDLERCMNYIHVNPLKHGVVSRVRDWPWSSFHRYVRLGVYPPDWGSANDWYGDEFPNAESLGYAYRLSQPM